MAWEEGDFYREEIPVDFDILTLLSKPKDYYRILEVDYDAIEETMRTNYIRLALKWHPDKRKGEDGATSQFQEINEAYKGVPSPVRGPDLNKQWPWDQTFNMVSCPYAEKSSRYASQFLPSPYERINIMHMTYLSSRYGKICFR